MIETKAQTNYAERDQLGRVAFYVLLWKREGISLELFDNYWKDVHGPVCARLPGQYQYWQFHVAHNQGGFWPQIPGLAASCDPKDNFDGIAELTFTSEAERAIWFKAAGILMDDEHNLFSKAIGYTTSPGNSITYRDGIADGSPNGEVPGIKFHVPIQKAEGVSVDAFRQYLTQVFAPAILQSEALLKFRLHLFDDIDNSRPDAAGVVHAEAPDKQYHAACEIAFANHLEREKFFASTAYAAAIRDASRYIRQLQVFPERTAHTFVYNGQMTLAGQRSAKVADLITRIGAANQLKQEITSLMVNYQTPVNGQAPSSNGQAIAASNGTNGNGNGTIAAQLSTSTATKSSLGKYLQGVQHFGITVNDLDKALEFYIEVLGGRLAIGGDGFIGDELHNLLFQKEDLEAAQQHINPRNIGIPSIRDGSQDALDVRFISFGNTCVELIHFRQAKLSSHAPNVFDPIPSGIGHVNAPHISFFVKDDVDLNEFAQMLEAECHRRGMTNVVANRTINVKSKEDLAIAPHIYAKTEFPGDFDGWALFYCKGPNGEQLEFNQVRRNAKENFTRAQREYNVDNDNHYWGLNGQALPAKHPGMSASHTVPVNATEEVIWQVLLDKMENPGKYMPYPVESQVVLERYVNGMLRQIKTPEMLVTERVTVDEPNHRIIYDIVNYPMFRPTFINQVSTPPSNGTSSLPLLTNSYHLQPLTYQALEQPEAQHFIQAAQPDLIEKATLHLKHQIEQKYPSSKQPQENPMTQTLVSAGPKSEIVRQMFLAGESMNVENFVKFYTEDAHYQFSNFPVAYGPQGIKDSSVGFLQTVAKVYHHITKMWEQGDTVICEMEVTYIRHDGKVFRLPCCDTIVFKGDKVQELRIFMDISPVFETPFVEPEKTAPQYNISQQLTKMYDALHAENWAEFKTFFTDDVLYKIGANDPVIGPDAIAGLLQHIYKTLKLTTHNQRGFWEIGNTIILEMDANYVNKQNKTFVQVPCTDIYRFTGDKISEWRVYPDASKTGVQL
ncbi:MAG: AtaL-like protein [Snowella sp.]|nr:AtaL-like protein [Snowella sp.]